jgi:hypothetical protein
MFRSAPSQSLESRYFVPTTRIDDAGGDLSGVFRAGRGHFSLAVPFAKAYAGAAAVLVNKFDTSTSKHLFDDQDGFGVARITADLDVGDCISVDTSRFGQIAHGPI